MPSKRTQLAIDDWLEATLATPGRDLNAKLELAATIGSPDSIEGEIRRWLSHRPRRRSFGFMMDWGAPDRSPEWYARMKSSPNTKPLIERFLREELPFDRDYYCFCESRIGLADLARDLSPTTRAAVGRFRGWQHSNQDSY